MGKVLLEGWLYKLYGSVLWYNINETLKQFTETFILNVMHIFYCKL